MLFSFLIFGSLLFIIRLFIIRSNYHMWHGCLCCGNCFHPKFFCFFIWTHHHISGDIPYIMDATGEKYYFLFSNFWRLSIYCQGFIEHLLQICIEVAGLDFESSSRSICWISCWWMEMSKGCCCEVQKGFFPTHASCFILLYESELVKGFKLFLDSFWQLIKVK